MATPFHPRSTSSRRRQPRWTTVKPAVSNLDTSTQGELTHGLHELSERNRTLLVARLSSSSTADLSAKHIDRIVDIAWL